MTDVKGRKLLVILLVAAALASGCLRSPETGESLRPSPSPAPTQTERDPVPTERPFTGGPVTPSPVANLTGCDGYTGQQFFPTASMRSGLPDGYQADLGDGAVGSVIVWLFSCAKVAIDGRDEGSASFAYVTIDISHPEEVPASDETYPRFVVEFRTNNSGLARWLFRQGAVSSEGDVSVMRDLFPLPDPYGFASASGALTFNNNAYYSMQGVVPTDAHDEFNVERFFFGPEPKRDYLDINSVVTETGANEGRIEVAAESVVSKLAGGLTSFPVQNQDWDPQWIELKPALADNAITGR